MYTQIYYINIYIHYIHPSNFFASSRSPTPAPWLCQMQTPDLSSAHSEKLEWFTNEYLDMYVYYIYTHMYVYMYMYTGIWSQYRSSQ